MALNFLLKRSGTASKRPNASSMALGEIDLNYDASTGGIYYKDSAGNVVKVGPCQVSATAPNVAPAGSSGNSAGEFWFDTANQALKVWNGSAWVDATSTAGFLPLSGGTMTGDITFSGTQSIPVSSIAGATTSQAGVVQLNDTTSSTSTTEALTANQGKELQDQINALSVTSNLTFAGTIDASTGDLVTVTTEGTAAGFTVGDPLPSAASGNDNYFVIVTIPGTMTPPGGSAQECHQGDWFLSSGTAWEFLDVGFNATAATTSTPGVVQLATDAEVQAGLNTDHAVTSSGLQSKVSDSTSTTSSTALASSTAVKSAYDAGIQGQTDAATALAAANAAGTDVGTLASLTTTDKTSAVAAINEVNAAAGAAQGDATQALSDASAAQTTADQAVLDAAAAQGDANQALSDAASAQATADAAVPDASYTALGDILSGTGAGTYSALPVGTDGQVLQACAACATGLAWTTASSGGIPCSVVTAKGTLVTGTAANTPAALAVGTYGQVLLADSGCATGLKWGSLPTASVTGLGTMYGCATSSAPNNTSVGYYSLAYTSATCTIVVGNSSMIGSSGDSQIAIGVSIAGPSGATGCNVVIGNRIGGGNFQNSANNVVVGQYATCNCFSDSNRNVILGASAALTMNSACNNVVIGYGVAPPLPGSDCTLAIGYSTGCHWITGDSTKAIKPGAGIIDCADSCGTAGQVLMSNGANAVCWGTAGGGGGSGTVTSITAGTGLSGGTITTTGTIDLDTACVIQPTVITAKGDLIAGTAVSTPTALGVGTDGQVLTACSACASGLTWAAGGGGGGGSPATPLVEGIVFGCTTDNNSSSTTAVGHGALFSNTASFNTALGTSALAFTTTGANNTAVGAAAGAGLTTGEGNTFIGNAAGLNSTTSTFSVAVGMNAACESAGYGNVAVGQSTASCAGSENVAVGSAALTAALSGANNNTAIGSSAGFNLTTGSLNVIIGNNAGSAITTGSCQLAIGYDTGCHWLTGTSTKAIKPGAGVIDCANSCGTAGQVLMSNGANAICWGSAPAGAAATPTALGTVYGSQQTTILTANTFYGYLAGPTGANATCNVAIGYNALNTTQTGVVRNIAIGAQALDSIAVSNIARNVAIGFSALTGGTAPGLSGCDNVAIGDYTGAVITTGNRNTWIGSGAGGVCNFGQTSNDTVLIGASASLSALNTSNQVSIYNGSVNARFTGAASAWTFASDSRDKENIVDLALGLDFVNRVQPRTFTWNMRGSDVDKGKLSAGFIAQELQELTEEFNADCLEIVDTSDSERYTVAKNNLIPVLVNAIKELSAKNDALELRIAQLESNG